MRITVAAQVRGMKACKPGYASVSVQSALAESTKQFAYPLPARRLVGRQKESCILSRGSLCKLALVTVSDISFVLLTLPLNQREDILHVFHSLVVEANIFSEL